MFEKRPETCILAVSLFDLVRTLMELNCNHQKIYIAGIYMKLYISKTHHRLRLYYDMDGIRNKENEE